jgi:hypothetical protein
MAKKKSVIERFADAVGETVRAAVMPTRDIEAEAVAAKTNEQIFLGDASIAPEAAPAIAPTKRATPTANKRVATAKNSAKKAGKQTTAKKSAKNSKKAKKSKRGG